MSSSLDRIIKHLNSMPLETDDHMHALLEHLNFNPGLLHEEKMQELIRQVSNKLRDNIECEQNNANYAAKKLSLLTFHKYPYLVISPKFSWLTHRICKMITDARNSSISFKEYWMAIDSVKRGFQVTKIATPEKSGEIFYRVYEAPKEEKDRCDREKASKQVDYLQKLYKNGISQVADISKMSNINGLSVDTEILRFKNVTDKYCKKKRDSDQTIKIYHKKILAEIYGDDESDKRFWKWVEKQISKAQKSIKPNPIRRVSEDLGITQKQVRRHLKAIEKMWKAAKPIN